MASLFRRRAYNIDSLTVGHTEQPGISRMTIVVDSDPTSIERLMAYLYKLVNVLQVSDLTSTAVVNRDLAMIKVTHQLGKPHANHADRGRIPGAHRRYHQ